MYCCLGNFQGEIIVVSITPSPRQLPFSALFRKILYMMMQGDTRCPYSKIENQSSSSLSCWLSALFVLIKQMKEEELIRTKHVGEVMKVLHDATDHAYNPDELLTVPLFFSCFLSRDSWVPTYTQL